ncbi:class I SAM-dependent methyltransferase [Alphaproteobacteria bacterium LSUCC0684]
MIRKYFLPLLNASGVGCILPRGQVLHHAAEGQPTLKFHRYRDMWRLVIFPDTGLAELYAEDRITITGGDISDLLHALINPAAVQAMPLPARIAARSFGLIQRLNQGWTRRQSRKNVHAHYDLGNALYALFLDKDWQYSCAYFHQRGMTLDDAQKAKKDHIRRKLRLEAGARVLDIGCGWGGMAMDLARAGAMVKGVTLSDEQYDRARQRAADAELPIIFAHQDYREKAARYDRIVSVGMLEHVGKRQLSRFFSQVEKCLEDDGLALIHTIGRPESPRPTSHFIQKYIFPGGYIPSLSELTLAVEKTSLAISDIEVLFLHYAETLRSWRENFLRNRQDVLRLYDERFARIWEFYLAASEASFRHKRLVVYQLQLVKPETPPMMSRAYLHPGG